MTVTERNRKNITFAWQFSGIFLYLFTIAVALTGFVYLIWSFVLMIQRFYEVSFQNIMILEFILNLITLLIEFLGVFYTVMLLYHMASTCMNPPSLTKKESIIENYPAVSILIPIRHPEYEILKETLVSISEVDYPKEKLTVFLGDDTEKKHESYLKTVELAHLYNVKHIHDPSNIHFKAGMLNVVLKHVTSEFFILLDYDHKIEPKLITKSVKLLMNNSQLAFVQSKVNFRHVKSKLQVWESVMYAQFYEVFQRSKTKHSTVLTNGSTACYRKSYVDEIGGIPFDTFTEDVDISVKLLAKGYKTELVDEYGSFGLIPANFSLLLSQILRWAKGSMQVLRLRWKKILSAKMPFIHRIDLLFSASLFFIAASVYLNLVFYVIMFFTKSTVVRLPMSVFPPLLIMPIAFAVSYQLSGIIAVLYARRSGIRNLKLFDLVYFLILALVLNPFTVYAVFKSMFKRKIPSRDRDEWNEKVPYFILSFIISILGGGLITISIFDILGPLGFSGSFWLILGLLGLTMLATFPVCIFFHFSTKHNKPYFVKEINT